MHRFDYEFVKDEIKNYWTDFKNSFTSTTLSNIGYISTKKKAIFQQKKTEQPRSRCQRKRKRRRKLILYKYEFIYPKTAMN